MRIRSWLVVVALAGGMPVAARAQIRVLDFEGIGNGTDLPQIQDFYNGGTSSDATTGTDFGISFSTNARGLCLNTLDVICGSNTSRGGLGDAGSQLGGLEFLTGGSTFMSRAGGFTDGFSFFYTQPFSVGGTFSVFDGLDGTGNLLATVDLAQTPQGADACPDYHSDFCPFVAAGVSFSGTAMSVVFAGANDLVVFDDVTFGSATPGQPEGTPPAVVPEPGTLSLLALGLVGMAGMTRRRKK